MPPITKQNGGRNSWQSLHCYVQCLDSEDEWLGAPGTGIRDKALINQLYFLRADNGDWVCVGVMTVTEEEMRSQEDGQAGWENGPLVFNIPTGFYSLFDLFSKSLSILLVSLLYTLCFVNIPDVNTLSRGYILTDTWSMPPIRGLLFLLGP